MTVVSGIDDFEGVGTSFLIKTEPLDLYKFSDGELILHGPAVMETIYISTSSKSCVEWQAEKETIGRLSQKVIDAAGANLDISNACSEMNELQAFYDEIAQTDYPQNALSFTVPAFLEASPYVGTFDVIGFQTYNKTKCGSYWSADSCSFIDDSCNEEEKESYSLEGSVNFDMINLYATGILNADRLNEEGLSIGNVDIELNLEVCDQPSIDFFIPYYN